MAPPAGTDFLGTPARRRSGDPGAGSPLGGTPLTPSASPVSVAGSGVSRRETKGEEAIRQRREAHRGPSPHARRLTTTTLRKQAADCDASLGPRLRREAGSPRVLRGGSPSSRIHESILEHAEGEPEGRKSSKHSILEVMGYGSKHPSMLGGPGALPIDLIQLGSPFLGRPAASTPTIILGCWQLSCGHSTEPVDLDERFSALAYLQGRGACAVDLGGDNDVDMETRIGQFHTSDPALAQLRHGGLRLRFHTKLTPDLDRLERVNVDHIEASLKRSIRRMNLPHGHPIDLVQLHWWDFSRGDAVAAAKALMSFTEGHTTGKEVLAKSMGLTNFDARATKMVLDAGVPVASCQVQLSLLDRRPICGGLLSLCAKRGVSVICYGSLAGGLLSDRYLGASEPEWFLDPSRAPNKSLRKYALIVHECGGWETLQELLGVLRSVADDRDCERGTSTSVAEVAIAWALRQTAVSAVVVGTPSGAGMEDDPGRARAEEIARAAELDLTDVEVAEIESSLTYLSRPREEHVVTSVHTAHLDMKTCNVGQDQHAQEILSAWNDGLLRISGGLHFSRRCQWEGKYCLEAGQLTPNVAEQLRAALKQMETMERRSLERAMAQRAHDKARSPKASPPPGSPGPPKPSPSGSPGAQSRKLSPRESKRAGHEAIAVAMGSRQATARRSPSPRTLVHGTPQSQSRGRRASGSKDQ